MDEKVEELRDKVVEECELECHEEFYKLFKENGITEYKVSVDDMFDSPGYDVYSLVIAWVENGELHLLVDSIGIG